MKERQFCPACGSHDVVIGRLALDREGLPKRRATAVNCMDCGERFVSLSALLDLLVSAPLDVSEDDLANRDTAPPEEP